MPKAGWNLLYKSNCPIGMIRPNRKRKQLIIKCLAKILTLAVVLQVLYVSPGKLWHLTSYAFPYQLPTQERALKRGSRFRTLENPWRQKVDPVIAASRSASGGENICWGRTNEQPYIGKIKIYVGNQKKHGKNIRKHKKYANKTPARFCWSSVRTITCSSAFLLQFYDCLNLDPHRSQTTTPKAVKS